MNVGARHLATLHSTVPPARFDGGTVDLSHAAAFTHPPRFDLSSAPAGLLLPPGTNVSDLP
ncbi:hypothetical protein [Streptomyces sp. NBC_01233]|uniref:hypothetical protein n=1 Tax=Streptomyces sp. NBC_01233 TaxID=2903787 RepID=UPI002E15EB6A|nr:hypothetical protein OG332_03395 [Streptomyces sp. NBC_01233]